MRKLSWLSATEFDFWQQFSCFLVGEMETEVEDQDLYFHRNIYDGRLQDLAELD